jgi:glutamate formiminotransferase / 5-formyltetrahydrofolate cyclo-ligase
MERLVLCIPNFSEGRRTKAIDAIVEEVCKVKEVKLLDVKADVNHNRVVVTFIGGPEAVKKAAFLSCAKATSLINMEEHHGEHPRIGATDVIPFIPVRNITLEQCARLADDLAREIAEKLEIPVYLYEAAAKRPELKRLPDVRKGQYEGLKQEISTPERKPDYGPSRMHPTAGATAVGARNFLIAFNVNLGTNDLKIAKKIANTLREARGGYRGVRAIGVMLDDRKLAQVSTMVDFVETPLYRVFETVKFEAARYGVNVIGSEVIGLTPAQALLDAADFYLRLEDLTPNQVLENNL